MSNVEQRFAMMSKKRMARLLSYFVCVVHFALYISQSSISSAIQWRSAWNSVVPKQRYNHLLHSRQLTVIGSPEAEGLHCGHVEGYETWLGQDVSKTHCRGRKNDMHESPSTDILGRVLIRIHICFSGCQSRGSADAGCETASRLGSGGCGFRATDDLQAFQELQKRPIHNVHDIHCR